MGAISDVLGLLLTSGSINLRAVRITHFNSNKSGILGNFESTI